MRQKIFLIGLTMAFGVVLTGCHMKHEWKDADCTRPRTCAVCGETEGEALGHDWQEADCTRPRTCAVCGETQGEALGHIWQEADCTRPRTCSVCGEIQGEAAEHDWQEADYFAPQTCTVCGKTQGEPLQPSFEAHGLSINARVGETYDYVTCCAEDKSLTTVGKLTFSDYRIFEDRITEGYEWRAVHIKIEFSDDNARDYGIGVHYSNENYYDTEAWDEVYDREDKRKKYTIRYNGKDYTECESIFSGPGYSEWENGVMTWEGDSFVIVPAGYDGMVVCFRNAGLEGKTGDYIYDVADEDTIFFRMSDEGAKVIPPVGGADSLGLLDQEQTLAAIKEQLTAENQALLYEDDFSVVVLADEDTVIINARTYKDYLIPALAGRVTEKVYELRGRSVLPLDSVRLRVYCTDEKENGDFDSETFVYWETEDMEAGTFNSMVDGFYQELYTIEDLYEYYEEDFDLIDKAMNGERVDEED